MMMIIIVVIVIVIFTMEKRSLVADDPSRSLLAMSGLASTLWRRCNNVTIVNIMTNNMMFIIIIIMNINIIIKEPCDSESKVSLKDVNKNVVSIIIIMLMIIIVIMNIIMNMIRKPCDSESKVSSKDVNKNGVTSVNCTNVISTNHFVNHKNRDLQYLNKSDFDDDDGT